MLLSAVALVAAVRDQDQNAMGASYADNACFVSVGNARPMAGEDPPSRVATRLGIPIRIKAGRIAARAIRQVAPLLEAAEWTPLAGLPGDGARVGIPSRRGRVGYRRLLRLLSR